MKKRKEKRGSGGCSKSQDECESKKRIYFVAEDKKMSF